MADGAGNDGEVVSAVDGVLHERGDKSLRDAGVAEFFLDGKQADFAERPPLGKVHVEVFEFLVERERPLVAEGDHPGELPLRFVDADNVGILFVELIDELPVAVGLVLGDLLDEGFVVQRMDGLDLPRLVGYLEYKFIQQSHLCLPLG